MTSTPRNILIFALVVGSVFIILLVGRTRQSSEDFYSLRERTPAGGFIPGRVFNQSFELPDLPSQSSDYEVGLSIATYNRNNPGTIHFTFRQPSGSTVSFIREGLKLKDNHPLFFSLSGDQFKAGIVELEIYSDDTPQGFGATAWATATPRNYPLILNGKAQPRTLITRVYHTVPIWDVFRNRVPSLIPRLMIIILFSGIITLYLTAFIRPAEESEENTPQAEKA